MSMESKDGTAEPVCGQQWRHRQRESKPVDTEWDGEGKEGRQFHGSHTHYRGWKTESRWESAVWNRELSPELCDNLEAWDGEREGKGTREGGHTGIPLAHLVLMYGRNQHSMVKQLSSNKLKKKSCWEFRQYYPTTVTKTAWKWHKSGRLIKETGQTHQKSTHESSVSESLTQEGRVNKRKDSPLQQVVLGKLDIHMSVSKAVTVLHTTQKDT